MIRASAVVDHAAVIGEALDTARAALANLEAARKAERRRRRAAVTVDHGLPAIAGRIGADAGALAHGLRFGLAAGRKAARNVRSGAASHDDAAALAWLAVDALALVSALEPDADGWRAARIGAEAAAETGGRMARAHVVAP